MLLEPNERDKKILIQIGEGQSLTSIGKEWNVTKQRINQINKRWSYGRYKDYKPVLVVEEAHTWTSK
jgi:hypothetical protein